MSFPVCLAPRQGLDNSQIKDILLEAILPEYRSEEKVREYVIDQVSKRIVELKANLGELEKMAGRNFRAILEGDKPLTQTDLTYFQFGLDMYGDKMIPFDFSLPDEKYTEIYTKITGRKPEQSFDPTGRANLIMMIHSHFFPKNNKK